MVLPLIAHGTAKLVGWVAGKVKDAIVSKVEEKAKSVVSKEVKTVEKKGEAALIKATQPKPQVVEQNGKLILKNVSPQQKVDLQKSIKSPMKEENGVIVVDKVSPEERKKLFDTLKIPDPQKTNAMANFLTTNPQGASMGSGPPTTARGQTVQRNQAQTR